MTLRNTVRATDRRRFLRVAGAGLVALGLPARAFANAAPVLVGLDLELLDHTSTADDAIALGASLAIDHVNARGGVLNGRPLQLVSTDNRSVPARGVANAERLAGMPDLVAYLCGKFSPVALAQLPTIHRTQLPLLNPWAAAEAIVHNQHTPNYAFRLGLHDSITMERLLADIRARKLSALALIAPATAWGRSCQYYVERYIALEAPSELKLVGVEWHHRGSSKDIEQNYRSSLARGAQAIVLIANESEGAELVRALAAMPRAERRPLFSHWGITGGRFAHLCGRALHEVELQVAQSFSFARARGPEAQRVATAAMEHFKVSDALAVPSMTGIGPAYDLVRLLAMAIDIAGTTHRPEIHRTLEHLPPYDGLVRRFAPAFSPDRHEALASNDVLICQFDTRGRLLPRQVG